MNPLSAALEWWRRMHVAYWRQQAGRAALALLLAPREEIERHGIRDYYRHASAELARLELLTNGGAHGLGKRKRTDGRGLEKHS